MLRTRFLSAATAAVLLLGMTVGGAGAAFATQPTDVGGGGGGTADSPCNFEPGFTDEDVVTGEKYNIPEDVADSGELTFEWGTLTWTAQELVFTANPGWTVDLCVKGGSQESNSIVLDTGSVTIPRVQEISHFMWANPVFTAAVATASISTNPRDCDNPTTWNFDTDSISNATWGAPFVEDGLLKIVATANAGALFAGNQTTQTFTATYEVAGGEDCDETTPVTPAASVEQISCLDDVLVGGTITVDLTKMGVLYTIEDSEGNPVIFDATTGKTAVLEPGSYTVYGVDADDTDLYVASDYEETFTVTVFSEECGELESVVVPVVTSVDECVEESDPDVEPAAMVPVASFTVTGSPNVSYTYTINGGTPIGISVADDGTTTIVVTPGDVIVVTAAAASGFKLPDGYEAWGKTFTNSELCVELPPLANWPASAVGTNEMCAVPGVMTSGTISVTHSVGPVGNLNPVRYYLFHGTPQQKQLVDDVTPVAPGSHTVTAVATEPTDSLNNSGNTAVFVVNVGAASEEDCGELETLALTGAGAFTEWLGVVAALMMVAGMGFVVRRNRVEV